MNMQLTLTDTQNQNSELTLTFTPDPNRPCDRVTAVAHLICVVWHDCLS